MTAASHTPQPPFSRDRSPEDDFQMAVQSLGVGPTDESVPEGSSGKGDNQSRDASGHARDEKAELGGDGAAGSGATKEAASPPEHPLQKAITSFDMALGELNQLVHLVDLARAREFMVLKRVTPTEEDQARAMPDQSVSSVLLVPTFFCTDTTSREQPSTIFVVDLPAVEGTWDRLHRRAPFPLRSV